MRSAAAARKNLVELQEYGLWECIHCIFNAHANPLKSLVFTKEKSGCINTCKSAAYRFRNCLTSDTTKKIRKTLFQKVTWIYIMSATQTPDFHQLLRGRSRTNLVIGLGPLGVVYLPAEET